MEVGMILSIEWQLVNGYIEPHFYEVAGGLIVTMEFGALESLPKLRKHTQDDLWAVRVAR
jgi:hypothetical protein